MYEWAGGQEAFGRVRDATIVRGVLLPASMKLLGDWNWYLPSWLEWIPESGGSRRRGVKPRAKPAPRRT